MQIKKKDLNHIEMNTKDGSTTFLITLDRTVILEEEFANQKEEKAINKELKKAKAKLVGMNVVRGTVYASPFLMGAILTGAIFVLNETATLWNAAKIGVPVGLVVGWLTSGFGEVWNAQLDELGCNKCHIDEQKRKILNLSIAKENIADKRSR